MVSRIRGGISFAFNEKDGDQDSKLWNMKQAYLNIEYSCLSAGREYLVFSYFRTIECSIFNIQSSIPG